MTRTLLPVLLCTALASPAVSAAPVPTIQRAPGAAPAVVPKLRHNMKLSPKVPLRLRMKVSVIVADDSLEGPGNTEDETYFALAGITKVSGVEQALIRRTVRPQISRDFWEMGKHSADEFEAVIFEGSLNAYDRARFALLLGEQDNKSLAALGQIFAMATFGIVETLAAQTFGGGSGDAPGQVSIDQLTTEVGKLADAMKNDGDELMGAIAIGVEGGKLRVSAPSNGFATVESNGDMDASVKLSNGGQYRVQLTLENLAAPPPNTITYLSQEDDGCGQSNLYVEQKGGGTVNVHKGDGGVDVRVKSDDFHWHCGSMSNDDDTNAPDDTKLVKVTRASSGGDITWDCYHEQTAAPQYTW